MRPGTAWLLGLLGVAMPPPASAQIRTVDPNQAAQAPARATAGDTAPRRFDEPPAADPGPIDPESQVDAPPPAPPPSSAPVAEHAPPPPARDGAEARARADARGDTYQQQDLLDAAEGTFGKGAAGLGDLIQKILKKQGQPSAYISGREVSGAFGIGLRYGSGTLFHRVEGDRPVYWTGPSLGFDVGGNGAKEFVLVYNLYDTADLYHRFPAAEGTLYVVGGFTASYLRRGDIVLIPIRLGVGWRAGVNVGYMHFTQKSRILPF